MIIGGFLLISSILMYVLNRGIGFIKMADNKAKGWAYC